MMGDWGRVWRRLSEDGGVTARLAVPGGWLVRSYGRTGACMAFVPRPAIRVASPVHQRPLVERAAAEGAEVVLPASELLALCEANDDG